MTKQLYIKGFWANSGEKSFDAWTYADENKSYGQCRYYATCSDKVKFVHTFTIRIDGTEELIKVEAQHLGDVSRAVSHALNITGITMRLVAVNEKSVLAVLHNGKLVGTYSCEKNINF